VIGSPAEAGSQIQSMPEYHRLKSVAKKGMSTAKILNDIAHLRHSESPYRMMHHSAEKPSRQPIFLPCS